MFKMEIVQQNNLNKTTGIYSKIFLLKNIFRIKTTASLLVAMNDVNCACGRGWAKPFLLCGDVAKPSV